MSNQPDQPPPQQPATQQQLVAAQPRTPIPISSEVNALVPTDLDGAWRLAQWLSTSALIPKYKDKAADVFLMITTGMELGLPPNAALRGLYVVNGRVALESKTKMALCVSKRAAVYFKRIEYTAEATTWETLRAGQVDPVRMRFTRKDAETSGLLGKEGPWRNYPQRMQSHRALGWLCDDVYPDIVLGTATAEDFDEFAMGAAGSYRELGGGVSVSVAETVAAQSQPVSGVPSTARDANTKAQPAPPPKAVDLPEDEIKSIIAEMQAATKKSELKAIGIKRVHNRPMSEHTRTRLLEVYEAQVDLIDAADRDAEPTRKDS